MTFVEQAILHTLIYSDVFDYPLTLKELHQYLIAAKSTPEIDKERYLLVKKKRIETTQGYYFLPGKQHLVKLRRQRSRISLKKLSIARSLVQKLNHFPHILGVFLTGTLAMNNADESDDIDLMMITKANHLWTTRLLLIPYLDVLGLRRRPTRVHPGGVISSNTPGVIFKDKLCLNMWLDATALALPKNKRTLYTAHEVVQVKPLINKQHMYEQFLSANRWVLSYLPNTHIPEVINSSHTSYLVPHTSIFESLAYHFQLAYMKHKMSREIVTPHSAFFHPRDTGNQILQHYQTRCQTIFK